MNYLIYSDGAVSGNGTDFAKGGFAAVIIINGNEKDVKIVTGNEKGTTNQRMELLGALKALQSLSLVRSDTCIVRTDSAYLHNCYYQKWYVNWQKNGWLNAKRLPVSNRDLWEQLIPYFEHPAVVFEKVKGHSGNYWNEYVDRLAVVEKELV